MARFIRYLTAGIASLLLILSPAAESAIRPERQVTFTVFSAEPIAGLAYRPRPDAELVPLIFYPTARSPRYDYSGPSRVQLFESATGKAVANVNLEGGIHNALLILSGVEPVIGDTERYNVRVLDDGARQHAPGTLLILNLSGLSLSGTINQQPITLRDGSNTPLRAAGSVSINLRTLFKERTYQAYAETIVLSSADRAVLLLLPPYRRGSLEVQSRILIDAPAGARREKVP